MTQDSSNNRDRRQETGDTAIKSFTDLKAWEVGHELVLMVYKMTDSFPDEEQYSLVDQMRRSAVSNTSNIAEGFGRCGYGDKERFYYMAQGSVSELKNQLLIARDLEDISPDTFQEIANKANRAHALLQGLISSTKELCDS